MKLKSDFFGSPWVGTMLFATMNVAIMIVSSLTEASAVGEIRENKIYHFLLISNGFFLGNAPHFQDKLCNSCYTKQHGEVTKQFRRACDYIIS